MGREVSEWRRRIISPSMGERGAEPVPGTHGCMSAVCAGQSSLYCVGYSLIGTLFNKVDVSPTYL